MQLTRGLGLNHTCPVMQGKAIFSACGTWRYRLEREWGAGGKTLAFIMVNPSTANALVNDPTISRCIRIAEAGGYARLIVGNLFAFCASDIKALRSAADSVGPDNDAHLRMMLEEADRVVVAWGSRQKLAPPLRSRWQTFLGMARDRSLTLHCLGTTKDGHPRHPLYLPAATPLAPWRPPPGR
jgi:hypothetical protein